MEKTKEDIRREIKEKLKRLAKEKAVLKSKIIKEKLFSLAEFKNARCVMLYASMPDEVDTTHMIDEALEMGKRVALPFLAGSKTIVPKEIKKRLEDLRIGTFGIYEPLKSMNNVELGKIDLIVVPGVAFDKKNRRLGRGKGCYDRFLKSIPPDKVKVGLAFDFQLLDSLPEDSHDIPVSKVITS